MCSGLCPGDTTVAWNGWLSSSLWPPSAFAEVGSVLSCLFLLIPAFPPGALCLLPLYTCLSNTKQICEGWLPNFIANGLCISTNIFNSLLLTQIHSAVLDIQGPGRATLFFKERQSPSLARTSPSLFPTPFPSSTALVPTGRF